MALFSINEMRLEAESVGSASMIIAMEEQAAQLRRNVKFDIFLSHSFSDKVLVKGVWVRMRKMGYSVYVDWINDPGLDRANVNSATAELLRNRMSQCSALFYAVSGNSSSSKWMAWELGFKDGEFASSAILPIVEQPGQATYSGLEYLGLYHYASDRSAIFGFSRRALAITTKKNGIVNFDDWISKSNLRRP